VDHVAYVSNTGFDAFISRLETQLGRHDFSAYQRYLTNSSMAEEAERMLQRQEGSSGFMLFSFYDHGSLLSIKGTPRKARQYVLGNPLYAARMTQHDIRAGLYAPLRVLVYADESDRVHAEYDLPTTVFGQFQNDAITAVARELDNKLSALIESSF
jgi:uncharacterized protein (DUF302 family)